MERFKNKTFYILIYTFIVGLSVLIWNILIGAQADILNSIGWALYGATITAILTFLIYPRKTQITNRRLRWGGVLIPICVMGVLSVTWGLRNPHFPNGGVGAHVSYKLIISQGIELGVTFFVFLNFLTLGLPYLASVYLSLFFDVTEK